MTEDACPDPGILVAWWEGSLPQSEQAGWEPHVAACRACQAELATLTAVPQASSRRIFWRLPAAAAAVLLLAAGGWALSRQGRTPPLRPAPPDAPSVPAAFPAGPGPFSASSLTEMVAGPCGAMALAPGSEGRWEGGDLHLKRGTAWVEACGAPLRIFPDGLEGHVELTEGKIVLQRQQARETSFWLRSACAGEGAWRIGVPEGEAFLVTGTQRRRLTGGMEGLPEDPRRWHREAAFHLRDAVRAFPVPEGTFVGEILLRKQARESGADVLFRAGGRGWRLPLGAHLPEGTGWIRLRLETGPGGVRFLAGGREVFKASTSGLPALLHDGGDAPAFGLKAWGGDVEVKEARWR